MSDDRVNVACPYCGETYNLLASSIGTWWKCQNDQCRHGFKVEDPSGGSPETPRNDNEDYDVPGKELEGDLNTDTLDGGATAEGIISLETHIPTDDESPVPLESHPVTNLPTHPEPNQEDPHAQPTDWPGDVTPHSNYEVDSGAGPQELDTFINDETIDSKSPVKSGGTFPGEDDSIRVGGIEPPIPMKPTLTKKQTLQRRMKRIAAFVLVVGVGAIIASIILRPQPNAVTDWADAVRLYEERKWNKAKRAFSRYGDNFPESDQAQEIPFFIDMCKAGDDIFSRTGNPDRGWKGIQDIYKTHQKSPAYASYANRFREAIEELKNTFVDQARDINSQVGSITPKDVIKLNDSGGFIDHDQTNADIQTQRDKLQEASERLNTATKTLDHLENVSLASVEDGDQAAPPEAPPATDGNLGRDIESERRLTRYLKERLGILEQFATLLNVNTQFGPNQLDELYDAINGGLDELQSTLPVPPPTTGVDGAQAVASPNIQQIDAWQKETDELLREAYKREAQRITYMPFRHAEQISTPVILTTHDPSKKVANIAESLFVVRGDDRTQLNGASNSQVYFSIARGVLYAFDAQGKFLWARRLGLDSYTLPVSVPATTTAPQRVVAVSTIENKLLALNARTGEVDWTYAVNLDQNLLAPLTVIRVPAIAANKPDHIVGLLPTATGQIHVLELNRGRTVGIYQVGHPLSQSGAWDPETGHVFFAADAKRVFAISPMAIAQGLATGPHEPTPAAPSVLYTNHAAGSLRGPPSVLGSCLITAEIADLERMKLRAFEINKPVKGLDVFPEIKQLPLKEFTVNGLSWFEPARIPDRLAVITDEGQLGIYGINLDNITEAMYPLIESEDGGVHSVSALENSRSMVVQSDEQFAWILANGEMQHLFLDVRNQKIKKIWPREGEESPVKGYPLHKAQADDWSTTFYIASADLNDSESEFTAVDAAKGTVIWHRILGLKFFGDPRPLEDGSVALLDQSGALVKLSEQDFVPGVARNILSLPPLGAKVEIPAACKREDMELIRGKGENLYLVGYAKSERSLYAKRVGRRSSGWYHTPLPYKPLGKFVIRDGKLVAACEDGLVYFCDFRADKAAKRTQPFQWDSNGVIDEEEGTTASVFIGSSSGKISDPLVLVHGKKIRGLSVIEEQGGVHFQQDGEVQVSAEVKGSPIISRDGDVCVACNDDTLNWIDLDHGSVVRSEQLPRSLMADPSQCGSLVCVALDDRSIMAHAIDRQSNIQWRSNPLQGDIVGKPMMLNGNVVVTDLSGQITAIDARNGKAVWAEAIKLGPGQIPSAAAVPIGDDHLLVPLIDGSFVQVKIPGRPGSKGEHNSS